MCDLLAPMQEIGLLPHLYTLRGSPTPPWMLAPINVAIATSHFTIAGVLLMLAIRRRDALFRRVAVLVSVFLSFWGISQTLALWTVWHPSYQVNVSIRMCLAVLTATTAVVMVRMRPLLERLPTVADLQKEIDERQRAQEAEREKDERYRNLVEGISDYAMYMIDLEGRVQTWNEGAQRIKGYTAEEIVGKHFSCFYTEEDKLAGLPDRLLASAGAGGHACEGWRVRKDGSRFWASVVARPLYSANGSLRGFSKITRDMTKAREVEHRFETVFEHAPHAVLICDEQGRIEMVNAQMEKLYGYSRGELIGRVADEVLVPERLREEYRQSSERYFAALGPGVVMPSVEEMKTELSRYGLRSDGREFEVELTINPILTGVGTVAFVVHRDVAERNRAERRFRSVLESAPDAMVIVDDAGHIQLTNLQTERLFGYTRAELVESPMEMLVPRPCRDEREESWQSIFSTPKPSAMGAEMDLMAARKDGSDFPVEIALSPLYGQEGGSVIAAIRDVSERRAAARLLAEKLDEVRQSNQALEQFAHVASHDLQEPLRMVASYVQLLAKRYQGRLDSDADEFIGYAVDGTQRMKRLIEDLLLYSRAGKGGPPVSRFEASAALKEALNNLHTSIQENNALVTYDPLPEVETCRGELVQILQNLIGNAVKYRSERTPEIHISGRREEQEWLFSVADNGIGIDPKYFERIFVVFQRLHGREEYQGTGIGLAICKRIMQHQGGRIWVESEPGMGSVFHFALPIR